MGGASTCPGGVGAQRAPRDVRGPAGPAPPAGCPGSEVGWGMGGWGTALAASPPGSPERAAPSPGNGPASARTLGGEHVGGARASPGTPGRAGGSDNDGGGGHVGKGSRRRGALTWCLAQPSARPAITCLSPPGPVGQSQGSASSFAAGPSPTTLALAAACMTPTRAKAELSQHKHLGQGWGVVGRGGALGTH